MGNEVYVHDVSPTYAQYKTWIDIHFIRFFSNGELIRGWFYPALRAHDRGYVAYFLSQLTHAELVRMRDHLVPLAWMMDDFVVLLPDIERELTNKRIRTGVATSLLGTRPGMRDMVTEIGSYLHPSIGPYRDVPGRPDLRRRPIAAQPHQAELQRIRQELDETTGMTPTQLIERAKRSIDALDDSLSRAANKHKGTGSS